MKLLLPIICTFLLTIESNSQTGRPSISLYGGTSIPCGRFSSTDLYSDDIGQAKTGWSINAEVNYQLKQFGILGQYRFQKNAKGTKLGYPHTGPPNRYGYFIKYETESWETNSLLVGTYYTAKISRRFQFDFAAKIGVLKLAYPDWSLKSTEYYSVPGIPVGTGFDTVYTLRKGAAKTKWNLQYGPSGKLKYQLNKRLLLISVLDYSFSNASLQSYTVTNSGYHSSPLGRTAERTIVTSSPDSKQKIATFNLSLGVQVRL